MLCRRRFGGLHPDQVLTLDGALGMDGHGFLGFSGLDRMHSGTEFCSLGKRRHLLCAFRVLNRWFPPLQFCCAHSVRSHTQLSGGS